MLYQWYEFNHAAMTSLRAASAVNRALLDATSNVWADAWPVRLGSASLEMFERATRRYPKPQFDIGTIDRDGVSYAIKESVEVQRHFCDLRHFKRVSGVTANDFDDPKVLLVAPMSGHFATLLRDTVRRLASHHEVYITDWHDARDQPQNLGPFDLDDYIDAVMEFVRHLGPRVHVIAVCQPGPAVVAATALMAEQDDPATPASVTLMGSPIDTRMSPTEPNEFALSQPLEWFEQNLIHPVPLPHAGATRRVYPGFLQLAGFMNMNIDRHWQAHGELFAALIAGDEDSAERHRQFYDEYMAVMDLTAEYYLQTIELVFQRHALPDRVMRHRGHLIKTEAIRNTALLTIEGELDDISGIGQTQAAHDLFDQVPAAMHQDYVQAGVGHYGVFNGSRWRKEIAPRIAEFIATHR